MHTSIPASLALALAAPLMAHADTPADVQALRQELAAMRAAYEQRLQALELRLKAAEAIVVSPAAATPAIPAVAPQSPVAGPTQRALPSGTAAGANAFNPALSLILSGTYLRTSRDPAGYAISGVALPAGGEAGPGSRGFSLSESELGLAANIDPYLRGAAAIAIHPDNTVSVEEAYIQTTALSNGLTLKAGRFFSGIGYLNEQHAHTWDFADNPLAYQAFLGTQFGDDGVQLRWLAPTDLFVQVGAEVGRGRGAPGSDTGRNGAGASALYVHAGGDIGESHSWRAGVSMLNAKATGQQLVGTDALGTSVANTFTGSTRVWIGDFVWKWAPNGNATRTNFKLQGEYLRSTREGELADLGALRATQSGWYLQGIYQFMPRWRAGLRAEALSPGAATVLAATGVRPRKESLMLDYNPSEFSRVRLQLARDRAREGLADNQLILQYQMSLGAHGAHGF